MRVSLRRTGGFLDVDQTVDVNEAELRIVETGASRGERRLDGDQEQRVDALARAVLDLPDAAVTDRGELASDDMVTEIEVDNGDRVRQFILHSGADAPAELWALINGLDDLVRG